MMNNRSPHHLRLCPSQHRLWDTFKKMISRGHLSQTLLMVGADSASRQTFARYLTTFLLCQGDAPSPCGQCKACHLCQQGSHPDVLWILPEAPGDVVKIDQIRTMQETIHHWPQQGKYRFVVVEGAHKMTVFAANALLKVIEEPPMTVHFILLAEHLSTLPATILSRCQRHFFSALPKEGTNGYLETRLSMDEWPKESSRACLFESRAAMIRSLYELAQAMTTPCMLAEQWSTYTLDDLLWLLYLLAAEAIFYQFTSIDKKTSLVNDHDDPMVTSISPNDASIAEQFKLHEGNGDEKQDEIRRCFYSLFSPVHWFRQLECISMFMKKSARQVHLNKILVLEQVLMGFSPNQFMIESMPIHFTAAEST